ncbi:MAG: N-acetylmuramoyl-L-alanine amidase, partial [Chloroflexota bacterium]
MPRPTLHIVLFLVLLTVLPTAPAPSPIFGASLADPRPSPLVSLLVPRTIAMNGVTAAGDELRLSPRGGTATLRVQAAEPMANIAIVGRLTGHVQVRFSAAIAGAWKALDMAEPADRNPPHTVATELYPLPTGYLEAELRITFPPSPAGGILKQLRIYAEIDRPTKAAEASRLQVTPDAVPNPATADASFTADSLPIVSRLTWGSPDGEGSPAWIPAYQDPFHIIIHHTAGPSDAAGAQDVLDVWSGHALELGWGDIGYNYLIDSHGTVYEGRAGGPTVVGGHTKGYNYGSIGIALIGNYDVDKPSRAMISSLVRLVTQLSDQFGIDVRGITEDGSLTYSNLAGHRDFNPTSCPGDNVYRLLPSLRDRVARSVHSEAALIGTGWLDVGLGTQSAATLQVQNTGTTTWNGRFSLRLVAGSLPGLPSGFNLPDVPPGGTITIPLFLPAVTQARQLNMTWQLYDASGFAAGPSFPVSIEATEAQPSVLVSAVTAARAGNRSGVGPNPPARAWATPLPNLFVTQSRRPASLIHAAPPAGPAPDPLDSVGGAARRWYFAE